MASPLSERIGSLVDERTRLDALLTGNIQWQALRIARVAAARGEATAAYDVERLESALSANAMFRAREALDAAIRELSAASAAESVEADDARASLAEVVRSRPEARVHTHPPTVARESGADDLTLIRGIDAALAAGLAALGVTSYAAIAGWSAADVARFASRLGLGTEISRGNWIEQAAVLAAKGRRPRAEASPPTPPAAKPATQHAAAPHPPAAPAPVAVEPVTARPTPSAAEPSAVVVALRQPAAPRATAALPATAPEPPRDAEVAPEAPAAPDRLTLILGLSAEMADWLAAAGVTRFAEIAAWTAGDIACYGAEVGIGEAARQHSWIEQAAVLASGRPTRHARRVLTGEWDALVPPPRAEERPDGELRAKLIAASLLSAANAMLRIGPLPPAEPVASEPASGAAEELQPSPATEAPTTTEEKAADAAPAAHDPVAIARPPVLADARFGLPRLAEQIAPLRAAAPAAPEHSARSRLPTLGSWSAPGAHEEVASVPAAAAPSEAATTGTTVRRPVESEWLVVPPGEAEVFIHQLDDAGQTGPPAAANTAQAAAAQPEQHRPPFRPRHPATERASNLGGSAEEASVEIYTHGEQPRVHASAARPAPAAEHDAVDASSVRRFLKVLTGR
ncbi:MAG: hypothetical protein AB1749_00305 [Pseudomonadota bacterium]